MQTVQQAPGAEGAEFIPGERRRAPESHQLPARHSKSFYLFQRQYKVCETKLTYS